MRKFAVAITLLVATLFSLVGGTASASTPNKITESGVAVENVAPLALRYVCANTLMLRGSPGGAGLPGKVLRHGDVVNTLARSGAYVKVDSRLGRGWVVGRYLC